ncbi:MAG: hypothetical protein EA395_11590 [Phormidium sp. GEM2.Bin31]|nr:MAG: hypothetical protein EA395_11590 [Phormidium sp. GEM2.Bin31]
MGGESSPASLSLFLGVLCDSVVLPLPIPMKPSRVNTRLLLLLLGGSLLRLLTLGDKALWLDEVLTALFSFGREMADIPQGQFFPVSELPLHLSLNPEASCQEIAITLARESTHPPLFFCWLQQWLRLLAPLGLSLADELRSLPALLGVLLIGTMYWLNRLALSPQAGLLTAGLVAVSPFAVYLSQEARHYTLPLLLISLSLGGLMSWIRCRLGDRPLNVGTRPLWVICHSIGLYSHYFMAIAYLAQMATYITLRLGWNRLSWTHSSTPTPHRFSKREMADLITLTLPGLLFLPWLSQLSQHLQRSETDWFQPFEPSWTDHLAPLGQTLASWVVMWVTLPIEQQPWAIAIPSGLAMLGITAWLARMTWQGGERLWSEKSRRLPLLLFLLVTAWTLLGFAILVYGFGKDITVAPRYHFVYYPSLCALVAAALSRHDSRKSPAIALVVGLISSLVVISGFAFEKPYQPRQIAQQLVRSPSIPLEVVIGYENSQEIALGLSFALELPPPTQMAFLSRQQGYEQTWQHLAQLPHSVQVPDTPSSAAEWDLWIIAPGLREAEYPPQLLRQGLGCDRIPDEYYRLGIPYQRYHCQHPGV